MHTRRFYPLGHHQQLSFMRLICLIIAALEQNGLLLSSIIQQTVDKKPIYTYDEAPVGFRIRYQKNLLC